MLITSGAPRDSGNAAKTGAPATYMATIAPFLHLIVYPPMMRQIGRD
jgi:hypothetical protein